MKIWKKLKTLKNDTFGSKMWFSAFLASFKILFSSLHNLKCNPLKYDPKNNDSTINMDFFVYFVNNTFNN